MPNQALPLPTAVPTPSNTITPVTNGDFFRGIEFNRLQDPNFTPGTEELLFIFGAQRANELDEALAVATQTRVESTERLNGLNEILSAIQNGGPGATVPLSLDALAVLNNSTPPLISPGVGTVPPMVTAPSGPAFDDFIDALSEAGLANLVNDFQQVGPGGSLTIDPGALSPGDGEIFELPGVVVTPGSVLIPADQAQFDQFTQDVENAINEASSDSQLDLIQFQAILNRRNQTAEFLANLIQRFFGNRERIAGNLRA